MIIQEFKYYNIIYKLITETLNEDDILIKKKIGLESIMTHKCDVSLVLLLLYLRLLC